MPQEEAQQEADALRDAAVEAFNRHGFSFQYAVLKEAERLMRDGISPWRFQVSEFPVRAGSLGMPKDARVDFVLSAMMDTSRITYMVAECKRSSPRFSKWVFARAPMVRREDGGYPPILFEKLTRRPDEVFIPTMTEARSGGRIAGYSDRVYHHGLPVRTTGQDAQDGRGREVIELAAKQVITAHNGFVNEIAVREESFDRVNEIWLVPVIFTTAEIWTLDADLSRADLLTGELTEENAQATRVPWLWYQYHFGDGIGHRVNLREDHSDLDNLGTRLYNEYARSIAVVSANGVEEFFGGAWFGRFNDETV